MKKRVLSFLLIMLMLVQSISTIPLTASAAESSVALSFSGGSGTNLDPISFTDDTSGVSAVFTAGTHNTKPRWDASCVRFYGTSTMTNHLTVSVPEGGTITKIVFTMNGSYGLSNVSADSGNINTSTTTWTGSAAAVVFTTTAQTRINSVTVTYTTSGEGGGETTPPCEHTNTEAIGESKDATCTEDGITAGEKCADCGKVITEQETIPAGHKYVDGECSVCHEKQPTTLTINRDSFGTASGYAWHAWTATTTTGTSISGSGFIYGDTKTSIQMNGSRAGDYIYNTTALPGKIVSITLTKASGTDRNFDILTSDTPFDSATAASLKGQATDAKKLVTTDGVTWTFETNHKYFAIVIVDSSVAYLSSIEITYFVCAHTNTTNIGEPKDATCTEDGITAGLKCSDCGEVLTAQETIPAPGHTDVDPADSKCDTCGANLCTEHKWVDGDVIDEPTCTKTGLQEQYCEKCNTPGENKVLDKTAHTPETDAAVDPTCTTTGLTEGSHCSVCEEVLTEQEVVAMIDHNYVDNVCSVCGDIIVTGSQLAEFQFGDNRDSTTHFDGQENDLENSYTVNSYTLQWDTHTKVYGGAYDAKGNSALKLGTKSAAAFFSFTVPANVNTVVLYIAGYKADDAKVDVNGTEHTITSKSNEGAYTKIVVDTTTTKTVTLETLSGGYRAMIDSIEFWGTPVDKVAGNTVTFGDNIGVNFYMELTDATLADDTAYMKFTLPNGDTTTVYVKDATLNGNYYKFTADIAVKEMADTITAQLVTATGNSEEYTYTVQQYAMYIIDSTSGYSDTEKALAKAMLNYGAYAQIMFSYNTGNLANSELESTDQALPNEVTIEGTYQKAYTNVEGVKYLGTSTVWNADTYIRHYFDITAEDVTFTLNGKTLEVKESENGKYVEITGILAKDMATTYELVASNGTTVTYSVYSYFYDILNGASYTDAQKNAAKAAYLYSQAVITYQDSKNN